MTDLLPRARLTDVLSGRASLVGSRLDPAALRGLVSPVESRVAMGLEYEQLAEIERVYLDGDRSRGRDLGVVARAAVGAALSPGAALVPVSRPRIVSAVVDNVDVQGALDLVFAEPMQSRARLVFFVHAHALNLARFDRPFRETLARADVLLPDGIGIRLAARMMGVALRANVNGTDMLPLLVDRAAEERVPLVLVGAAEGVAEDCADALRAKSPRVIIPWVSHGYLDDSASRAVADRLRELGHATVLVGMGSPRQERWALRWLGEVPGITVVTVGGLFDFYSDRVPRAPMAWRELGLEWLFRLKAEPRRLGRRYLLGNPLFVGLAVGQRLAEGRVRRSARSTPPS